MVERKKPKETSSKSSSKSSKLSVKVTVPIKKSESKIDGVGEFECSSIVSTIYFLPLSLHKRC